jgi:hypothetical protein
VVSPADATAYAEAYHRALGLSGVRAERVLAGEIRIRRFTATEPEMMWNQKYGHRARPRLSAIQERVTPDQAGALAREALSEAAGRPGKPHAYYGYMLFPLCDDSGQVGEAAVNAADGTVAWSRFPEPPAGTWEARGAAEARCP